MGEIQWKPAWVGLLGGMQLVAALFTTYRPAEAAFFVEHLLPSLLALTRSPTTELEARSLYFGELALELQRRRGKLSVFSSTAAEEGESFGGGPSGAYPWLWRYVTPFTVGAQGAVIQHAKLWLLHWANDEEGEQALEIYISSTNLTEAAFKGQIQAGWRAIIQVGPRRRENAQSWGPLTRFLEALGAASGPGAADRVAYFGRLLERCEFPEGVAVVASIPGRLLSPRERTGSRALAERTPADRGPLHLNIASPFIGSWEDASLRDWCADVGLDPDGVQLAWVPETHPWCECGYMMTPASLEVLRGQGVSLTRIGSPSDPEGGSFGQPKGDERWSHAKLYGLRRGRVRRLLITSANFSPSAWGAGDRRPRNFELGVLVDADWPITPSVPFGDFQPLTTGEPAPIEPKVISWASATWNGKVVEVSCRLENPTLPVAVEVRCGPEAAQLSGAVTVNGENGGASLPWSDPLLPPLTAVLRHGQEELEVAIADARPEEEFDRTPLPEVDPAVAEALREALLLERYGGPAVEPGDVQGRAQAGRGEEPRGSSGPSDYSVAAIEQARAWFRVVDAWRQAWTKAQADGGYQRDRVREDGKRLLGFFKRRSNEGDLSVQLPARLVADELELRVEEASHV